MQKAHSPIETTLLGIVKSVIEFLVNASSPIETTLLGIIKSVILLLLKEKMDERYGVLIEFKYIKKETYENDNKILEIKKQEAKQQIEKYKQTEEIKMIPKIRSYTVVAIKDELYVDEI